MDRKFKSFKSNSLGSDILQYLRTIQKDYDFGFGIKYQSKKIKDISILQDTINQITNPELKSSLENILAQQNISNDFRRLLSIIKTTNEYCKQISVMTNKSNDERAQLMDECQNFAAKFKDLAEKVGDYKEIVLETILNKVKFFIFPKNDEDSKKITDIDTLLKKINENFSLKNKLIEQINAIDMKSHDTALSYASRYGMLFVVEYLLKLYAYPGVSNDLGVDSLSSVILHLKKEPSIIERKAPNKNANISKLVEFIDSEIIAEKLFESIILLLIKSRTPFNVRPDGLFIVGKHFRTTLLHELVDNTHSFLNRVFIELISGKNIRVDINCQNGNGFTPIFKALEKYNELTNKPTEERDIEQIKVIENNIMNLKNLNARIDIETVFGPRKGELRSIPMFIKYYLGENPELEKIQIAFKEQFDGLNSIRKEAALINKANAQAFTANRRAEKAEREAMRLQRMLEKEKRIEETLLQKTNSKPQMNQNTQSNSNIQKNSIVEITPGNNSNSNKTDVQINITNKINNNKVNKEEVKQNGGKNPRKFKISKMKGSKYFEAETPKKAAKKAVEFIEKKLSIKKTGIRYELMMEDIQNKNKKYKYIIKRKIKGKSEINAQ
jgi:hypothetical protein